ncbi:hypothetical protein ACLOJK_006203 [Asimina triloba]
MVSRQLLLSWNKTRLPSGSIWCQISAPPPAPSPTYSHLHPSNHALILRYTMMILKISVILLLLSSLAVAAALCPDSGPVKHSTLLLSFLQRLQATALQTFGPTNFDPKLYVDLPLKFDLPTTEAAFYKLPRTANGSVLVKDLEIFIGKYFGVVGSDLVTVEPADFVPVPENFLPKVESPEVRAWALEVHSVWRNLSRKVSNVVCQKRDLHTLLPLPDLVVIPGSRFREIYYWDSYWTIRGLLASKMYKTAKAIASNLISLIEEYGFVLNGARSYYTNRRNSSDLTSLSTTSVIPVDLNVYILKSLEGLGPSARWGSEVTEVLAMELDIAFFARIIGEKAIAKTFSTASKARHASINSIFWNSKANQWLDYWLVDSSTCEGNNVEGLVKSGIPEAYKLAEDIAIRWITTNYASYKSTGAMHEKYDVEYCGKTGGGGEYIVQTGFGWSNGVVLAFLQEFGWPRDRKIDCLSTSKVPRA